MNIVITVDDNYIRPALIMLESLFEQNRTPMHIYLLHSNVCAENLSKLTRHVAALGGDFTDIRVDGALFEGAPVNKYFTKEMYYRLLIYRLLPEEERALYLDPDIIIRGEIDGLYHMDFEGKMMIAIPDYLGDSYYPERKKNLGLGDAFLAREGGRYEFPDQDLINVYFKDRIKYAPREYNFTTEYVSVGDFLHYLFSPRYRRSERVVIAHYMGKCKPWKPSYYYKYYGIYYSYLKKYLTPEEKRQLRLRPWLVFRSVAQAAWRVLFG